MRNSERHQNSLVLWIMAKHFACVFLARRNQYTNVGKMFFFLNLIRIKCLPSIVVTNRPSIVIAAERNVIAFVVNMSTYKYNWEGLNESAFPAYLYLSQYYIFRDYSVKNQCLSIDFIALIPQKLTISTHQHQSPLLLIKSGQNVAFSVQRHCF